MEFTLNQKANNKTVEEEFENMDNFFANKFNYDKEKYYVVIQFFDYTLRSHFTYFLNNLDKGNGLSTETCGFCPPNAFDSDEMYYGKNLFLIWDRDIEVTLDKRLFMKCIRMCQEVYTEYYPQTTEEELREIKKLINDIEKQYTDYKKNERVL